MNYTILIKFEEIDILLCRKSSTLVAFYLYCTHTITFIVLYLLKLLVLTSKNINLHLLSLLRNLLISQDFSSD